MQIYKYLPWGACSPKANTYKSIGREPYMSKRQASKRRFANGSEQL